MTAIEERLEGQSSVEEAAAAVPAQWTTGQLLRDHRHQAHLWPRFSLRHDCLCI